MCFNVGAQKVALKATKDIIVYKAFSSTRGDNKFSTPYQSTVYTVGVVKKAKIRAQAVRTVSRGLHSCITISRAKSHGSIVKKAVIPKGSMYFKNRSEYVSDALMILPDGRKSSKKLKK